MVHDHGTGKQHVGIRLIGVVLLACCALAGRWLLKPVHAGQHHEPSTLEYLAAAGGFLCFSAGSALTVLGAHIFDRVAVSKRWMMRRDP